jgi:sialidase-1
MIACSPCASVRSTAVWLSNAWCGTAFGSPPGSVSAFTSEHDGYHTYRIPALLTLPSGELILFCEARKTSGGFAARSSFPHRCTSVRLTLVDPTLRPTSEADDGHIDLVFKRSTDGGLSWSQLMLLYTESGAGAAVTIGNPCPVVVDGRILVVFCRNNKQASLCHILAKYQPINQQR